MTKYHLFLILFGMLVLVGNVAVNAFVSDRKNGVGLSATILAGIQVTGLSLITGGVVPAFIGLCRSY